ncbi:phosphate acetyltransferase [Urechidicola croceus]|uniref:Phosphate acetyltransferase n=1 Tax=Urechidicola croceus TaxID=1850246 RepID=A0A1D8P5L8_9FLAO|nr:phosphate acetyltransferase [Urechidicola croceus]AOW19850.1 phosphate acetyltransferase [Urechidicola croceus]
MNKGIYIATSEPQSGKSIVAIGLMRMLLGRTPKVGYFRPIINDIPEGKSDNHINTIISHFDLQLSHDEAFAFMRSDYVKKINQGKESELIDTIIDKYKKLEDAFDFVLVEGTDFLGEGAAIELETNVNIAKNLAIPAIIVSSGSGKTMDKFIGDLQIAYDSFRDKDVEVLSIFANKVKKKNIDWVKKDITAYIETDVQINVIPLIESLNNPTIKEIAKELDAKTLFGKEHINNQTSSFKVGAMQLRNHLTHLDENCLIITPGDRADIILGALQANISSNYPKISGIVLTGGLKPEKPILRLIDGLSNIVPIISSKLGTFEVANQIGAVKSHIYADNQQKILTSIETFENNVDVDDLAKRLITFRTEGMTPRMFQYNLIQKAKKIRKHIVLPEGNEPRILQAVHNLQVMDIVDVTLLGDKKIINAIVKEFDLNIDNATIINPEKSHLYNDFVDTFYNLRKHKNVTIDIAKDIMKDHSYFGTMMVYKGLVDGMVSGSVNTTQHTIRPALQFIKTKPNVSVVSSVFFMCLEDRVSVFGDCAINPNPNAAQLAEIAISSAESSLAFGIEPKIAMLSYSSGTSGKGVDVDKVREATEIVKKKRPDLKIEGPIQYDAAVDMSVAKTKLPNSEVAGQASVLIFPDLNTGNNTYKAVQRETGALAIGPMLQGLNKPVNDLSRGCTVDDIFNTIILTAIQAQDQ